MRPVSAIAAIVVAAAAVITAQQFITRGYTDFEPRAGAKMTLTEFAKQDFSVLTTELSPAAVVQSKFRELSFFKNMDSWGLGTPSFIAVSEGSEVKVLKQGQKAGTIKEPWVLCWFNGSDGWNDWDAPVLLVLQRKPSSIALSGEGLDVKFPQEAGMTAVMPLYGYEKVPCNPLTDYLKLHGMTPCSIATNAWQNGLPKPVVERCRHFSRILRAVPVYCREDFSINGDDLVIRSKFNWLTIDDDWNTKPLKIAPLSPTLALAWWCGKNTAGKPFPMTFSQSVNDVDLVTQYGPYAGIENSDSYTVTMDVLKYINFAEKDRTPDLSDPNVQAAYKKLVDTLSGKFSKTDWQQIWDHGGPGNYCWQAMGDRWYGKAIPYLPPNIQINAKLVLRNYLSKFVLQESNYKSFEGTLLLAGPGVGMWGSYDDAGKFSSNLLESIWNNAYYTDSFDVVKTYWPTVKRFFITPLETDWKSFGRYEIAEMGDEAAPALSMARLAYKVGDKDMYGYASYIFGRELIHHYVKQVGVSYFREHQPWHSEEFMPKEVYLTNMHDKLSAWQIDGPGYPNDSGEKQYTNRWVRFSCEEVARFYQDVLPSEIISEMNLLTERAKDKNAVYKTRSDTAHIQPSIIRLRAILLNDSPRKLAAIAPPEKWKVDRPADITAMCLPFVKNSRPIEWTRLITPEKMDYVKGLERTGLENDPSLTLICSVSGGLKAPANLRGYPTLRWNRWTAPKQIEEMNGGKFWNFGQIVPSGPRPGKVTTHRLNWNTQVWVFE